MSKQPKPDQSRDRSSDIMNGPASLLDDVYISSTSKTTSASAAKSGASTGTQAAKSNLKIAQSGKGALAKGSAAVAGGSGAKWVTGVMLAAPGFAAGMLVGAGFACLHYAGCRSNRRAYARSVAV
uniref:Uncharacterized protein n=1 Tax=Magnetococcus massalia (strain MO-1) TaxID=451514 RepID=A0A1S7LK38_MAGMO|nr:Conserved protein of unknown function [Candidatus Magnetococcus massalia]